MNRERCDLPKPYDTEKVIASQAISPAVCELAKKCAKTVDVRRVNSGVFDTGMGRRSAGAQPGGGMSADCQREGEHLDVCLEIRERGFLGFQDFIDLMNVLPHGGFGGQ